MNLFHRAGRAMFATASIGIALMMVADPVSALSAGGVGGRPANPNPANPRTQSIFIFDANKGEVKSDVVLVSNNSDKTQTIDLYAVDGIVTNTGAYTCSQRSEDRQSVGAWIKLDKDQVTLGAGKTEEVGFTLSMPQDADVGEHNGCIVFQQANDEGEASGSVRIRTRQALRVVATVPGKLDRSVDIAGFAAGVRDGTQVFTLNLKNTGNVSADVDAKVYLKSLFGGIVYENGGGYPVLAGQKLDLDFENDKRPIFGGWYKASAKVSYDERAGTFGVSEEKYLITKSSEDKTVFITPTIAGALILALVTLGLGGVAAWFILRNLRRKEALKSWHSYEVKEGDNIQQVALTHDVSWKKLASFNSLSAPYTLNPGMTIRVPSTKETGEKADSSVNQPE